VRVVATSTLRMARNAHLFLPAAQQALGHEVRVLSGEEEAMLTYLGVAGAAPAGGARWCWASAAARPSSRWGRACACAQGRSRWARCARP
jgi:hypothetical protein